MKPKSVSDTMITQSFLRLLFGERKVLLTGDIERKAENSLLLNPSLLSADIVKVPHMGVVHFDSAFRRCRQTFAGGDLCRETFHLTAIRMQKLLSGGN
jgi:hypothetical protein